MVYGEKLGEVNGRQQPIDIFNPADGDTQFQKDKINEQANRAAMLTKVKAEILSYLEDRGCGSAEGIAWHVNLKFRGQMPIIASCAMMEIISTMPSVQMNYGIKLYVLVKKELDIKTK